MRGIVKLSKLGFLCLIVLAACTGASENPTAGDSIVATESLLPILHDLNAVDELKAVFNEDTGQPRLILILAPT